MCVWKVFRLAVYFLLIMIAVTSSREIADKRTPQGGQSWFVGSRYGRSSSGMQQRRMLVTPRRDDRFHPGSRYGKRTAAVHSGGVDGVAAADQDVQCSYTGVADLYRCHVQTRKENISNEYLTN